MSGDHFLLADRYYVIHSIKQPFPAQLCIDNLDCLHSVRWHHCRQSEVNSVIGQLISDASRLEVYPKQLWEKLDDKYICVLQQSVY